MKKIIKNNSSVEQEFTLALAIYKNGDLIKLLDAKKTIPGGEEKELVIEAEFPEKDDEFTYGIYLQNGSGTIRSVK